MRGRALLRLMVLSGAAAMRPLWTLGRGDRIAAALGTARATLDPRTSIYGHWVVTNKLPAFVYSADQEALPAAEWDPIIAPLTRRNWLMVGNRAIRLQCANDGTVAVFDETYGLRWLTAPDPVGTGVSLIADTDRQWGTEYSSRAGERTPLRTFGPTWFQVQDSYAGLSLTRTILCPEGEVPWLLVHVQLALSANAPHARSIRHTERWALRPRFLNVLETTDQRRTRAELAVTYAVSQSAAGPVAQEQFAAVSTPGAVGAAAQYLIGPPATLVLERLGGTAGDASYRLDGSPHPTLEIATSLALKPGQKRDLWFRFGRQDGRAVPQPKRLLNSSLQALPKRLPIAAAPAAPEAAQEIPWHAALLTGGLAVDRVIGGHTLDQASTYSYLMGFNGAARDPLQHALPLVYTQPDLALSVLRNSCAWAQPNGDLPYALDGAKRPASIGFRPSDSNLWALWLAAEYATATGDLAAFDAPLSYHPTHNTSAVPLREHLRRQFRFFVDVVGRGERGHVRILHADWNDLAIHESGVDPQSMIAQGSSVLNSAMTSWVLGVFGALATRLGEAALATEARTQADELRQLVSDAWNGSWFHRAYAPGGGVIGDTDLWLEVQPWALLCGAANQTQAQALLNTIDQRARRSSPLGARIRWPATGNGTAGGIWYSINMTLIWAATHVSSTLAWNEWRRMTLGSHTAAYPEIWEGTLSGPDSWNPPESSRPGRTWASPPTFAMQAFPVNNMHSHSQPLLAYLRLLGVEPTSRGTLAVGKGGDFQSPVMQLKRTGHGTLRTTGTVVLETITGTIHGGPGKVRW
ncbi:MAG TPA: hypothetical protein VN812_10530 [Candidatus Acidoferrales bacterium]|nr:hypothetical protein [Candidatus Acidoferrales bacterium]